MTGLIPVLIAGLSFGAIYAMMAIGFSLLWQTSRTVNFAQGDFAAFAAFGLLAMVAIHGVPVLAAALLALLLCIVVLGYLFRKTVVAKLHGRDTLALVIATFALSTVIENGFAAFWSPQPLPAPSIVQSMPVHIAGASINVRDVADLVIATVMILGLHFFLTRTRTGKALQATAQNAPVARMLGINTHRMVTLTFLINAALVAVAGILLAPIFFVQYNMGAQLGLYAFYSAIIGGFNRVNGALLGGLLVGLINSFSAAYISSTYASGIVVGLLIVVLLLKPEGLFGKAELVREFTA